MPKVLPFKALRPHKVAAQDVVLPKHLVTSENGIVPGDNKFSFYHVLSPTNSEGLPEPDPLLSCQRSAKKIEALCKEEVFIEDDEDSFYLIRIHSEGNIVHGIIAALSSVDYQKGLIKRHEKTRTERERVMGLFQRTTKMHTTPVLTSYKSTPRSQQFNLWIKSLIESSDPRLQFLYTLELDKGWKQDNWKISNKTLVAQVQEVLESAPELYIADGHHRVKTALNYMNEENAGDHYFTAVITAEAELEKCIYSFYRRVTHFPGLDMKEKLSELRQLFTITPASIKDHLLSIEDLEPRSFLMFTKDDGWQLLQLKSITYPQNRSEALDVSILQHEILEPIFEIENPSSDPRLRFGSVHISYDELLKKANDETTAALFLVKAPHLNDIIDISNQDNTMPAKSTSFEPKMLSGLFMMRY